MGFYPNSGFLYFLAVIVIVFVISQSLFFLIRAYQRAKFIGMNMKQVRKTIISTALFTIAPAISILIGIFTLSQFLGLPLPWIRLSVIGAITYELPAATSTASGLGVSLSEMITDPKAFTAIAWVMTLGILPSLIFVPTLIKPIQKGMVTIRSKDSKWGDIFITSLFLGMISAFLGMIFSNVRSGLIGWVPVFVLLFSASIMILCGLLIRKLKLKWLENYALSISLLSAMLFAVLITQLVV